MTQFSDSHWSASRVVGLMVLLAAGAFLGFLIPFLGIRSYYSLLVVGAILGVLTVGPLALLKALPARGLLFLTLIALLGAIVDSSFRARDVVSQSADFQTVIKLALWCSGLTIGVYNFRSLLPVALDSAQRYLLVFGALALVTVPFAPSPTYSFGAIVGLLCFVLLAPLLVERVGLHRALISLASGVVIILLCSLLIAAIFPGFGDTQMAGGRIERFSGLAGSPNTLGRSAGFVLLVFGAALSCGEYRKRRFLFFCALAIGATSLVLSDSRTALAAVVGATAMVVVRARPALILPLAILAVALAGWFVSLGDFSSLASTVTRTGRVVELTTLTGRTDIWSASVELFLSSPVWGHGYASTKDLLPQVYTTYWGYTVTQAHNMWLQALVTNGLLGATLLVVAVICQLVAYVQKPNHFRDLIFFFVFLSGLTEAGAAGPTPNLMTFFWMISLSATPLIFESLPRTRKT